MIQLSELFGFFRRIGHSVAGYLDCAAVLQGLGKTKRRLVMASVLTCKQQLCWNTVWKAVRTLIATCWMMLLCCMLKLE